MVWFYCVISAKWKISRNCHAKKNVNIGHVDKPKGFGEHYVQTNPYFLANLTDPQQKKANISSCSKRLENYRELTYHSKVSHDCWSIYQSKLHIKAMIYQFNGHLVCKFFPITWPFTHFLPWILAISYQVSYPVSLFGWIYPMTFLTI